MSATVDCYTLGQKMGEGATAKVYHATSSENNLSYAVKIFRHDNPAFSRSTFLLLR